MTAPARSRRGRPPARAGAPTRARVLAAARACFAEHGYDRTTNRAIAEAAGISAPAIYHYFPSKPELFAAVFEETVELTTAALAADLTGAATLADQFATVLRAIVELDGRDPVLTRFSLLAPIEIRRHPELQALLRDARTTTMAMLEALVASSRERGELGADVDDEAVVCLLAAVTMGLTQLRALVDSVDLDEHVARAVERLLAGTLFTTRSARRRS